MQIRRQGINIFEMLKGKKTLDLEFSYLVKSVLARETAQQIKALAT